MTILAEIHPRPDEEKPFVKVNRNTGSSRFDSKRRECAHPKFELDERWCEVSCQECGKELDPFAVLMRYAEWWEHLQREKQEVRRRRVKVLREEARRLKRLVDVTDEEAEQLEDAVRRARGYSGKKEDERVERLSELVREVSDARDERRAKRRG